MSAVSRTPRETLWTAGGARARMLDPGEEYHDLASLIRAKARKNGGRPALAFSGRTLSYEELDRETDRVAGGLARAGLARGDRLAALLFNTPEFPLLWFGAAKQGIVLVPLNTALKGEILRYELVDSAPRAVVVDRRLWSAYAPLRDGLQIPMEYVAGPPGDSPEAPSGVRQFEELADAPPAPAAPPPGPSDPASILYTSGTTGPPKGAIIPHEKLLTTPREIAARSRLSPESVLFTALPLFHCNAQEMTTVTALLHDLSAAYDERFRASNYWEIAARFGATHVSLLISMINVLYKQAEKPSDRTHRVRTALTAGATREVWPLFEQRFGVSIVELYGMTECSGPATTNLPGQNQIGSVGMPFPGMEIGVAEDGEVLIRGGHVAAGYYRNPEATAETFTRDGWIRTGDLGQLDREGRLSIVGRKKEIIITAGGKNVAPSAIEAQLKQHPLIGSACVVGDGRRYLSALITLAAEAAPDWAASQRMEYTDLVSFSRDPRVHREIQRAVDGANSQFARLEQIKRFTILPVEWTPEGGERTPTLKLRRRVIAAKFTAEIEAMYA